MRWSNHNDTTFGLCLTNENARSYKYEIVKDTGRKQTVLFATGNLELALKEFQSIVHENRFDMTVAENTRTNQLVLRRTLRKGIQMLDDDGRIGRIKWVDISTNNVKVVPLFSYATASYAEKIAKALEYIPMK